MTYTITITDPGAEPIALSKEYYAAVTRQIMSILFDLNGVNLVSFQKILAVCLDFLASAGVQKTVSLEWTTDAPMVAGWYWIISQEDRICVREIVDIGSVLHVDVNDGFEQYVSLSLYALRVLHWLGPIPIPAPSVKQ